MAVDLRLANLFMAELVNAEFKCLMIGVLVKTEDGARIETTSAKY